MNDTRLNKLIGLLCGLFGALFALPLHAQEPPTNAPDAALRSNADATARVYLPTIQGDLTLAEREELTHAALATLGRFPEVRTYTETDFFRQKEWEREQGTLACTFYEECREALQHKLAITHVLRLALEAGPKDDSLVIVMDLHSGIRNRTIREALPEKAAAPVAIRQFLPDLMGLADSLPSDMGMVRVSSRPLGAAVTLNQKRVGETPLLLHLPQGMDAELSCQRPNLPGQSMRLHVVAGELKTFDADLVLQNGKLLVDTVPEGATVFVDDARRGESPFLQPVLQGRYRVRLELPPYPAFEEEVEIKPGEVARISHGFVSDAVSLRVEAPRGQSWDKQTEIWLDGNLVAYERYQGSLCTGTHRVAVVRDGYETHHEELSLLPGTEPRVVSPTLKDGLAVRPGQTTITKKDYRPATFTTLAGVLALGFGVYLEFEAQKHLKTSRDRTLTSAQRSSARQDAYLARGFGATLMSLGSLATAGGVTMFFLPFQRSEAVWPQTTHPDEERPAKQEPDEPFVVGAMVRGTF